MKKLVPLILGLMMLMGCKAYDGSMVRIANSPISPKLPSMAKKVEDVSNAVVVLSGNEMKLFTQEIEENLTDPYGDKYGTISIRKNVLKLRSNMIYPMVSGFLLFVPNIFGFPMAKIKYDVEVELRILDSKGKLIGKYTGIGRAKVVMALYYGYGAGAGRKLENDAFNDAFSKIRPQIQNDMYRLNPMLDEAGKLK
jgi:hypothetical protein